jgi:hypothetical protein
MHSSRLPPPPAAPRAGSLRTGAFRALCMICGFALMRRLSCWSRTWRDFDVWPDPRAVGLAFLVNDSNIQHAEDMASSVLGFMPLIAVFLVFQRQIVEGIATTGSK